MSIRIFVKYNVKDDQVNSLIQILQGAKSLLLGVPGCEAVEVLHSIDDPNKVILSEVWQSKEIHDRYAATMDADALEKLNPFLKTPLQVELFSIK